MLRRFDDIEDNHEISSIAPEPLEYKSSTQILHKANDSFDSSFFIKHGSDTSFVSQISIDESYAPKSKLSTYQMPKKIRSKKNSFAETLMVRPASVLKTTFLIEDAMNYNFPKKAPQPKELPQVRDTTEISYSYSSDKHLTIDKSPRSISFIDDNTKIHENKQQSEKVIELENQIMKKDALIETLRTRVAKMVQELEETHRRVSAAKNNLNEDYMLKIQQLTKRCEDYETKLQESQAREKEANQTLSRRDHELSLINKEAKESKNGIDMKLDRISSLEATLRKSEESRVQLEKMNESLQIKFENSNKGLELSTSHKIHLEKEVARLENVKRTQENEMRIMMEENQKNISNLSKKLEETKEESKYYQQQSKETNINYDSLNKNYSLLNSKLFAVEEKLNKLDTMKLSNLEQSRTSILDSNEASSKIDDDFQHFTFHGTRETSADRTHKSCKYHRKSQSISSSFRVLIKEIMEIIGVDNIFDIIPELKKFIITRKEKKLVRKLGSLVKECFCQDRPNRDVTPAHIWRCIKRIFEEYAVLKKNNPISYKV